MVRWEVVLVLLVVMTCITGTTGFDLSFWDDDEDSSDEPPTGIETPAPTLSPTSTPTTSEFSSSDDDASPLDGATNFSTATPVTAISTVTSTYRNWVGPWSISPDPACYREAHIMDVCPSNYDRNDATNTCWTECPIEYPVECGLECIRQNDDCKQEIFNKVSVIAVTALDTASMGIFGKIEKVGRYAKRAVKCANSMMTVVRGLNRYVRNVQTSDPQTTQAQMLAILYQTNNVVTDIPIAIINCLGKTVPRTLFNTKYLMATTQYIVSQVLANNATLLSSWKAFKVFLMGANFTEAVNELTPTEISSLVTGMKSNSTCGADLKSLVDRTWFTVNEYREKNPEITDAEIRLKVGESDLVLQDVPTVTNNCMSKMVSESSIATAYKTRNTLRKTFGVIINDLIKSETSNNGTTLKAKHAAYQALQKGLIIISASGFDDLDISTLLVAYVQTVCGPTQFMGEIDDGAEPATLGLHTIKDAFKGSTSSWTRKGDGAVIINFTSTDTEDVTVNIMSGGDKVAEVEVSAGESETWTSTTTELGGKTLYLDRWRPGVLGLPGTGGGSLVLWVPRASQGGHLELEAKLNVS